MKEDVQNVEKIVLEWIKQIRHLNHYQPEDDVQTKSPTPSTEVQFWKNKEQMCFELITTINKHANQQVQEVLEIINSSYLQALMQSKKELTEEHARCFSTVQFLSPLDGISAAMADHNASLEQLDDAITAFLKSLEKIWYYAPFYGNQQRYTFMIRALANQVIDWGIRCLSNGEPNGRDTFKSLDILALQEKIQKI